MRKAQSMTDEALALTRLRLLSLWNFAEEGVSQGVP